MENEKNTSTEIENTDKTKAQRKKEDHPKKESALRKRFRNDEVTDEERAQDLFNKR